jgi:hypothetical protein
LRDQCPLQRQEVGRVREHRVEVVIAKRLDGLVNRTNLDDIAVFADRVAFGAQLGSSILAGCQFPDATLSRTDLRIVFGPAAGPAARRFDFRGRLVERGFSASRLVHPSRDCLPTGPDPGCDSRFRPVSAGIGSSRLLGGYSSFPALRVLPLCSQVAFPFAGGRRCFQHPPHSDLIVLAPFSLPAGRALVGWTHSATGWFPCVLRLRNRGLWAAFRWSDTAGINLPRWLTVATSGLGAGLCPPSRVETPPVGRDSACGWFRCLPRFVVALLWHLRSPPGSLFAFPGLVRPIPGEPVTCASGFVRPRMGGFRRGRERQFLPTFFPGLRLASSLGGFQFRGAVLEN